jgi:hypothetical protein
MSDADVVILWVTCSDPPTEIELKKPGPPNSQTDPA